MSTTKKSKRRPAKRIGVEEGANYEQRRQIILLEAARAFNEKGVQNTSLDDVAARLNVTKPALYHYVSSKDEIILLCLTQALEDNHRLLAKVDCLPGSGMDKLRYVFERWPKSVVIDFGRSIVLFDLRVLSDESRQQHWTNQRLLLRGIEAIIQEGIDDGSIRVCNPAVMTLSLIGLFNSPAHWYREDGPLSIEQITTELINLVERGMINEAVTDTSC